MSDPLTVEARAKEVQAELREARGWLGGVSLSARGNHSDDQNARRAALSAMRHAGDLLLLVETLKNDHHQLLRACKDPAESIFPRLEKAIARIEEWKERAALVETQRHQIETLKNDQESHVAHTQYDQPLATASAAGCPIPIGVLAEMRHRASEGCTGSHDGTCCDPEMEIHPEDWCNRCLMSVAARAAES